MKLVELKEIANDIIRIPETMNEYEYAVHEFTLESGGIPTNRVNVPIVFQNKEFRYNTTANGKAYRGTIGVLCADTGARDSDNDTIFITPDQTVFVFKYREGGPGYFDEGELTEPRIEIK